MHDRREAEAAAVADGKRPMPASPSRSDKRHYLQDALSCMDLRVNLELAALDRSAAEEDLKDFVRHSILTQHAERRLPLAAALEELTQQPKSAVA